MKVLNSWIAAVVACSAIASQANADVFLLASEGGACDVNAVNHLKPFDDVGGVPIETQQTPIRVCPVFVPGSLINKTGTAAQLMAQSVKSDNAARSKNVEMIRLAGRHHAITPIPAAWSESRPISTFAQFVQLFESAPGARGDRDAVQAMGGDDDEIVPKTSNMTLIGLFTFSVAGITAVISASRRGYFGRTPRQRRARMF